MKILSLREYHKRGTHRSEIGWSVPFCDSALGDFARSGMSPTSPAFLFYYYSEGVEVFARS